MKKLQRECPLVFEKIGLEEFLAQKDFDKEYCFMLEIEFRYFKLNKKETIWYQKVFYNLYENLKTKLTLKKTLIFFQFFINTCVTFMKTDYNNINMHAIGLFIILLELEKFYDTTLKLILPSENNNFIGKRYYLDIKRRVFNIYYYFSIGPETLNFYINSLVLFIIYKPKFKFSLTSSELKEFISAIKLKKKQLIFEFNQQFHYMYAKKSNVFFRNDPRKLLQKEFSSDYLKKLKEKNKYKLQSEVEMQYNCINEKKITELLKELKDVLEIKNSKKKQKPRKNYFDNYKKWL